MMKKQNLSFIKYLNFIWLILFFCVNSFSQNRSLLEKVLKSPIDNKIKVQKSDSLIKKFIEEKSDSLAYIYNDYAFYLFNIIDIEKIILYAEKALVSIKETEPDNISKIQSFSTDLAYYYKKNVQVNKAIDVYKEIILLKNTTNLATISYHELANIYDDLDDYYKAQEYYKIAISLLSKSDRERDLIFLRNAYINFMYACLSINTTQSLKEGFNYGKVADSLSNLINTSTKDKLAIKKGLALSTTREENLDFKIAYKYYNEALKIAEKTNNSHNLIPIYVGLGNLYKTIDQEKAIKYYKKSISLTKDKDTLTLGSLYYSIGQTYSIKKDYINSLDYKHKALSYKTGNDFIDLKTIKNELLIDYENKAALLINLQQLAQTYLNYYHQENNSEFLRKGIAYFEMCDVLINEIKTDSDGFRSRLYWRKLSTDIYGKAIKACFLINDTERAFYFMEKNKALLLLEDITNNKLKETLNLSPEVLEKEEFLTKRLIATNVALDNEIILSKSKIDSLKKQRIDLDIERSVLLKNVPIRTLDIETTIVSLKEVQNRLKENEVIVEYHISVDPGYGIYTNNENGYALFIRKNDVQLFEINNLDQLKSEVSSLTNAFKSPFNTQEDVNEFNNLSNIIYNKLFPTDEIKQLIKGKTLIIAPDSYLSLLPFESLSIRADSTSYLIRDAEIHYIYSNSFLKNIKRPTIPNSKSLVIAPVNFNNNLPTLTNSLSEVNTIQHYYSGSTLLNEQASKTNFLEALNTSSNGIIHIASHANAQDKTAPWIAFHDENITLEELYLTQNNASLVFLNGCNTTLGEQVIGEGVMSLARGFFYSGSQSVISSLWNINDLATLEITDDFYKNLSDGQTKATALHNAKLSYLNTHTLSETSPYYWASLILLGENDTLPGSKTPWTIYFIIISVIGLILFYSIKRKKEKL